MPKDCNHQVYNEAMSTQPEHMQDPRYVLLATTSNREIGIFHSIDSDQKTKTSQPASHLADT